MRSDQHVILSSLIDHKVKGNFVLFIIETIIISLDPNIPKIVGKQYIPSQKGIVGLPFRHSPKLFPVIKGKGGPHGSCSCCAVIEDSIPEGFSIGAFKENMVDVFFTVFTDVTVCINTDSYSMEVLCSLKSTMMHKPNEGLGVTRGHEVLNQGVGTGSGKLAIFGKVPNEIVVSGAFLISVDGFNGGLQVVRQTEGDVAQVPTSISPQSANSHIFFFSFERTVD